MNSLLQLLQKHFNEDLRQMIISNPADKSGVLKIRLRPLLKKNSLFFQAEEYTKTQVFHKNLTADEAVSYAEEKFSGHFFNGEISSASSSAFILVSKKGHITIREKQKQISGNPPAKISLSHNRKKKYIIEEGRPVWFLVELGVMTPEGAIVHAKYDKFRQINRFLEYIEDILPALPSDREISILDFGCGKSYLTFAVYYYLRELKGYDVRITGLDLKEDVITHCQALADKYGCTSLRFLCGDIAGYDECTSIDMVITLHACDTATDYAMAKAVAWNAKVILSVPCCQHELNAQISNELLSPVFGYGILKERMAALMTDGIRAQLLESAGYRTQILEFIDMAHTPKNLLIRAVYQGRKADNTDSLQKIFDEFHVSPSLARLLDVCSPARS